MKTRRTRTFLAGLAVALISLSASAQEKVIYPNTPDAKPEIRAALVKARQEHKRVILDFGGNWCPDCHVLDTYFHQAPNDKLLADNYILVDVNIGRYDMNTDVAQKYGVPLKKGVPAVAVLSPDGKVVYAQATGEFENMRHMEAQSVTDFLTQWKPKRKS
jgi:thioredoxin 1